MAGGARCVRPLRHGVRVARVANGLRDHPAGRSTAFQGAAGAIARDAGSDAVPTFGVMKENVGGVEIFTDGACSGNPGPGGWAALLRWQEREKMLAGAESATTNNRMEMMAAIAGLEALQRHSSVVLTTDSRYVMDGMTRWLSGWKRNGWRTSGRTDVKNVDLWQRLDAAATAHQIEWLWIRGHTGHVENERVDAAARAAIATLRTAGAR